MTVNNCYQCSHFPVCFLRKGIEDLLDAGFHKEIVGGNPVLKNAVPLKFFEVLASQCRLKDKGEK